MSEAGERNKLLLQKRYAMKLLAMPVPILADPAKVAQSLGEIDQRLHRLTKTEAEERARVAAEKK